MAKTVEAAKIPPQNLDAEKSILGAVLISDDAIADIAEILHADDFYDKNHGIIYAAMIKLYERHKPVDLLTLTDELSKKDELELVGGSAYLSELTNFVPSAAHARSYAEIVSSKAIRRRLIKASSEISELGFDEDTPTQNILEKAEAEIFSVSDQSLKQDLVSIESILTESFDRIEELHRNKGQLRGIQTGYRDLDNMTAGLQRSDLIILAARPAMGKTTLVTNLAYNVATIAKLPVLFFSLEMSKEQLVDRMLIDASGIDAWSLRTGNLTDDDFAKLNDAMGEMAEAPIFIDDTPGLSVLEMRTKARRKHHESPLGLIIVDYLQLMQASGNHGGNRVQEVSEISRGLKLIARELNVPLIALSQLSRSVESRTPPIPQLADLRESGSIEQDADIVSFIYRPGYYEPDNPEIQNITDLIIAKHRNGPVGKVQLYFHPERLRFISLDKRHD
ncbi:MAG TPA: replicative DNA helicase [Candidatus Saccharibacteria bacterium]|nr:replicative DNA helicase [Candidatus Saccharibacteria bacterium]HMR38561.1 replicative DNA helicase [Candidatus Saccharibacteria bacterium]